ncbi:Patatin-like phospholipase [Caloramator fervidus]|uniref:Patatin-like phospholipase n=1 Tax=Caloramator fervidus TaxID=29344 RepID=A0A1H5VYB0_9CLOT|nr:patatin-like phospholipase family protein [Caloramator fervidus]SEF92200.1 Patatin-like phospholipase [Caloramator fervidus]
MQYGLCLTGGGAKGAFQAGIIKYLKEKDINIKIITGTSIGAINAYFMMKNQYEKLYEFWNNMDGKKYASYLDKVVDNSKIIDELYKLEGEDKKIEKVYVNYVFVKKSSLHEVIVDIKNKSQAEALECVKASSLLPFSKDVEKFDTKILFEKFKNDVSLGLYDGFKLDGGILNNCLLEPFKKHKVDKIIIIGLKSTFEVPEDIYNYYKKEDLIVFKPCFNTNPEDTIKFEKDFCCDLFKKGYDIALKKGV